MDWSNKRSEAHLHDSIQIVQQEQLMRESNKSGEYFNALLQVGSLTDLRRTD